MSTPSKLEALSRSGGTGTRLPTLRTATILACISSGGTPVSSCSRKGSQGSQIGGFKGVMGRKLRVEVRVGGYKGRVFQGEKRE